MSDFSTRVSSLSPEKLKALDLLLKQKGIKISQAQAIPCRTGTGPWPLSFAQQRLWFLDQLEPGNSVYNIPKAFRLKGLLNVTAMEQSLTEMGRRHEILRTTFAAMDGQPVQIIAPDRVLTLPLVDLRKLPEVKREVETQRLVTQEAQQHFDLTLGPLWRVKLLRLAEQDHVFLLTMHHIISDGWSLGVFFRELAILYAAFCVGQPSVLPPLPIQYVDFAVWQRQWLQGEVLETQLAYWKQQLAGPLPVLELPTDRPRPLVQTYRGASQSLVLSTTLTQALKTLSQQEGATLFMTLLAAFKILLGHYSGQDDIVVGTPLANRNRAEIEDLIGFFINTLVIRSDLSGNPTFYEFLARVREVALGAYAHQDLPFEKLVEELQPERDLSRSRLFQIFFNMVNVGDDKPEFPNLVFSPLKIKPHKIKFDLTLYIRQAETLTVTLNYNTDLFETATIVRMLSHFQTLLEGIVANPERRLSVLSLLTEAEQPELTRMAFRPDPAGDHRRLYYTGHIAHLMPDGSIEFIGRKDCQALPLPDQFRQDPPETFVAPRNELEFQLARIWEQVLGIQPIGVRDNFFEVGGHSLLAVRLCAQIEKILGKNLPLAALFQSPTVEQIADILRQKRGAMPLSSLVCVQSSGSRLPFFCIPGNLGNIFADLGDLARHLGPDWPFYGFQDGIHNPAGIKALACHYLHEIQTVQSEGPYFLGGVCAGAVVAFEMAQQLQAQGQPVGLLALVEPSAPRPIGLRPYLNFVLLVSRRILQRFSRHSHNMMQLNFTERENYLRLKAKLVANSWALVRYVPQSYPGRIHLFVTEGSLNPPHARLGWRELAAGGTELHVIPGTHAAITHTHEAVPEETHLQVLAEQLRACLDDALATSGFELENKMLALRTF
ncbi:MAG: hypothetical protein HS126_22690 [Anaerolineales bacterium]|nr:hypothetical protein [Anaerolineales bacterium]